MPRKNISTKNISASEYIFMLLKHKLLLFFCVILGLAASFVIFNLTSPEYTTTARLTISPYSSNSTKEAIDSAFFQDLNVNTHLELLRSRLVLEKVINRLQLDKRKIPEQGILHQIVAQIKNNFFLLIGNVKTLSPAERHVQLIEALKAEIEVNSIRYTNIIEITVHHSDPDIARDIANALAEIYIQFDIQNNQQASTASFRFLQAQTEEFKEKLESAEKEFLNYKKEQKIFSPNKMQDNISEKIKEYENILIETTSKQQQLSLRLQELETAISNKKEYAGKLRSLVENAVIDDLNNKLISAEIDQSRLSKIYKSKHAKMQAIQSTINNLRQEIERQVRKEITNMKQEQNLLQLTKEKTQHNIEEMKNNAVALSGKEQQYLFLEHKVETYREYYDKLLSKVEETSINSEIRDTVANISFIEQAQTPLYPTKPDKKKIFLAGIFGGLFSGIGLALLLEISDRTIHTEEDVQTYFNLHVIGTIPLTSQENCRNTLSVASGEDA